MCKMLLSTNAPSKSVNTVDRFLLLTLISLIKPTPAESIMLACSPTCRTPTEIFHLHILSNPPMFETCFNFQLAI